MVRKGVPFRTAHHIIGQVVALGETKKVKITELTLAELRNICNKFDKDLFTQASDFRKNIEQYRATGGTSSITVKKQLEEMKKFVAEMIL